MQFLKNLHFRVGLIFGLFITCIFIVLPETPIKYSNSYFNINTSIGGYYINLFNGKTVIDLREFKKGLDLEGGVRITLRADMSKIKEEERATALDSAREVIERRVNFLGVSEPLIIPSRVGDEYRIIVEIPGVDDINTALDLVGRTAQLTFRQLKTDQPWDGTAEQFQQYYLTPEAWEDTSLTGGDLNGADVVFGSTSQGGPSNTPQIQLRFSGEGRSKFSNIVKENVNKPIGIFLDDSSIPLSMPVVSPDLADGIFSDPVITGNFDIESAQNLSLQIRAGALPVPVEVLQQQTIGATLGEQSIKASYHAGLLGFTLVAIFMVVLYGRLGLVADFALVLYGLLVLSVFKVIPVVLTLPGIAGFLLSIGMAVDANILIFERYREELQAGKPKSFAIKNGFEHAWSSIRDSNVSSLLTATILFYLGSGPIRGFALTLFIGISLSLFTSIFVVRTLISFAKLDVDKDNFIIRILKRIKK